MNNIQHGEMAVLDSGSGAHVSKPEHAQLVDAAATVSMSGFTGETTFTQGKGCIPAVAADMDTGDPCAVPVDDVELLDTVTSTIFSMCKLLRQGHVKSYNVELNNCYATTSGGEHVSLTIGDDDILYMPYSLQQSSKVNAVQRTLPTVTAEYLHAVFNHCSMDKIFQTLGVTKGYMQKKLPDFFCPTCSEADA